MSVEVLFETDGPYSELAIGYVVSDEFGGSVLAGWSPQLCPGIAGRHLVRLVVNRLPLAPGSYDLSLSLLTGGVDRPNYVYDTVLGFGRFSVTSALADGRPLTEWHRGWGRILHADAAVAAVEPVEQK